MVRELLKKLLLRVPGYSELVEIHGALREVRRDVTELRTIEILRILDFELANHPRYSDPKRLLMYAKQINSQNGEDGVIHEIFRRIGRTNKHFRGDRNWRWNGEQYRIFISSRMDRFLARRQSCVLWQMSVAPGSQ